MKVLLTGATGYIGSVVAEKLKAAGHDVIGLARSDETERALTNRQIQVARGDLESAASLTEAAQSADAVIHTAFKFDRDFAASMKLEFSAVGTFVAALQGSGKPLIFTSGTGILGDTGDQVFDETTPRRAPDVAQAGAGAAPPPPIRIETEKAVLTTEGLHGVVLRPSNVYGRSGKKTLLNMIRMAGQSIQAAPYVTGTADHKWTYVHVEDLADLYVLALQKAGARELFHAGAQSGLRTKAIAEALSISMGWGGRTVEMEKAELAKLSPFGPLSEFWSINNQTSNEKARRVLGWSPKHLDFLSDIAEGRD